MKHAFAFREYDRVRILQRPFFKSFHFPTGTDTEILQTLKAADSDSADAMEEKLKLIEKLQDALLDFKHLIDRHQKRLSRLTLKGKNIDDIVLKYFYLMLESVELMKETNRLNDELEKQIQERYRKEFAARLKQARTAAGLTQKQLGELIKISPNSYNHYETGKREPSLPTLSRLLKIFSAEQLFGRK